MRRPFPRLSSLAVIALFWLASGTVSARAQVPATTPTPPPVSQKARLGFNGQLQTTVVSNSVYGPGVNAQSPPNPGPPPASWYTFIPIFPGTGLSQLGLYNISAWLSKDFDAGTTLAHYATFGSAAVNQYWGVQAPWLVNPWNGRGSPPPTQTPSLDATYLRLVNDRVWLRYLPADTTLTYGSYHLQHFGDYLYQGQQNVSFNGGTTFPNWGLDLNGRIGAKTDKSPGLLFEGFYALIPDASAYKTHTFGGALKYLLGNAASFVRVNGVHTWNDNVANDQGPLVPIPGVPTNGLQDGPYARPVPPNAWRDTRPQTLGPHEIALLNAALRGAYATLNVVRGAGAPTQALQEAQIQATIARLQGLLTSGSSLTGFPRFFVGPQRETNLGLDTQLMLWAKPKLRFIGRYARSVYNPDTTGKVFDTTASGSLLTLGLQAEPYKGLTVLAQYSHVDPTYDPFLLKYPSPPGVQALQPSIKYYPPYWQQHSYSVYPNNFKGIKLTATYESPDKRTLATVNWAQYHQVKANTPEQTTTVGNIDSMYPMLLGGGNERGRFPGFLTNVRHTFKGSDLTVEAMYFTNSTQRGGSPLNAYNQPQFEYGMRAEYPIDDRVNLRLGYYHSHWPGNQGIALTNVKQAVTHVGFDFKLSPSHILNLDVRLIDMRDFVGSTSYNANQIFVNSVFKLP